MPVTNVTHCWVPFVYPAPANRQRRRVACGVHGLGWGGGNKEGLPVGTGFVFGMPNFSEERQAMAVKLCVP